MAMNMSDDSYEYIDTDTLFTSDDGIGIGKFNSLFGVTVYGDGSNTVKIEHDVISTRTTQITGPATADGSLYVGVLDAAVDMVGTIVSDTDKLDIMDDGSLLYVIDLSTQTYGNITLSFYNDDGSASPYSITVSSKRGTSGLTDDMTFVKYLNMTEGSTSAVEIDVWELLLNINMTDNGVPVMFSTTKDGGIDTVYMNRMAGLVTPLCSLFSVDQRDFVNVDEYTGLSKGGYITNWLASPRDVMDRSLVIDSGTTFTGTEYIYRDTGQVFYLNATVEFYTFMSFTPPTLATTGDASIITLGSGSDAARLTAEMDDNYDYTQ
jgi:hypothetical protein